MQKANPPNAHDFGHHRATLHWGSPTSAMASVPETSTASTDGIEAGEEPKGMEAEAALLSALAEIPSVSNAWCRATPQDGGMDLTVRLSS